MEAFETQKQKAICNEDICESCCYAEFDSPDYEYSCEGDYVSDCTYPSHNSDFAENIIEEMLDYETREKRGYCPFWLPRFPREWERMRCPACNSPDWEDVQGSINSESMTEKLKCKHCGEVRTEDIERVAYSCLPSKYTF
jgi:RNase P subunit RPR2